MKRRRRKANVILASELRASRKRSSFPQVESRFEATGANEPACNMAGAANEDKNLTRSEWRAKTHKRKRKKKESSRERMKPQVNQISAHFSLKSCLAIIQLLVLSCQLNVANAAAAAAGQQTQLDEYQLIGQARSEVRLPCLIGKQKLCGEPYFIAWYKLNATSRQWARIEAQSGEQQAGAEVGEPQRDWLTDRVHFDGWSREAPASLVNCLSPSEQATTSESWSGSPASNYANQSYLLIGRHQRVKSAASLAAYGQLFDCAQLTISALQLADEGQYKCEITFADSLDPERCPASTLTHLTVIARPDEPEILLNGRAAASPSQPQPQKQQQRQQQLVFKEGAQIRLECQSSGGKPAPRIEWLNVTSVELAGGERRHELQLLRSQWPVKRTHLAASAEQQVPLASSSISLTLSRFDLQSRFVCLVMAPSLDQQQQVAGSSGELPAGLRDASQLASQLERLPMLSATGQLGPSAMIKWIKLDILVKLTRRLPQCQNYFRLARPTSVSMQVLDLATNSLVAPSQMAAQSIAEPSGPVQQLQLQQQPFYSLRPNQLYAIQCLVENSRPRSQVTWFNRTSPIELETTQLDSSDFVMPQTSGLPDSKLKRASEQAHRISSFTRFIEQSGTYRTVATLLLTTNFYDNFEELFCRVSNEAFQFDELLQVAPILSVRVYVNYPLSVWLEAGSLRPDEQIKWPPGAESSKSPAGQLTGELGQRLQLRCLVAANPLLQNSILQIEWLKDKRRLQAPQPAPSMRPPLAGSQAQPPRLLIEKANHLHMPMATGSSAASELGRLNVLRSGYGEPPLSPMAGSSRLLSSSLLTIPSLQKQDAGVYSCQFKLIPAPTTPTGQAASSLLAASNLQQQQQQIKIVSGQASQPVQLRVIEAKLPVLRASSSSGPLSFLLERQPAGRGELAAPRALVLLANARDRSLQLKCELGQRGQHQLQSDSARQKVVWQLDGAFLSSSSISNLLNITQDPELRRRLGESRGGRLSCALQTLEPSRGQDQFSSDSIRSYQSSNAIELRWLQAPKLMRPKRRELMPGARSFSELELGSQPAGKLKLACLASCEPSCSIDWLLNGRKLAPVDQLGEFLGQRDPAVLRAGEPVNRFARRTSRLALGSAASSPPALGRIDTQLHLAANKSAGEPAWLRHSSLLPGPELEAAIKSEQLNTRGLMILTRSQLDRVAGQLLAELQEASDKPARANVLSKLELSYGQLGQLLGAGELLVECRLNSLLDGRSEFAHAKVHSGVWFPSGRDAAQDIPDSHEPTAASLGEALSVADEELFKLELFNLSSLLGADELRDDGQPDNTFSARFSLEHGPKRATIALEPGAQPVGELQLNESQLKQLLAAAAQEDQLAPGPILNCSLPASGSAQADASTQFKWTFTSGSQHVRELLIQSQRELNLKQLIELRRRQLQAEAAAQEQHSLQLELLANLFGNYTCTASSSRGSASASVALSYHGRPVCKLTLSNQQQQLAGEPAFACKVYSAPRLVETIWLRNEQPIGSNKSQGDAASSPNGAHDTPFQPIVNWLRSSGATSQPEVGHSSPLSAAELPLQQNSLLAARGEQVKCVARNSFGFSDPCELSESERQALAMLASELNGTLSNKLDAAFAASPSGVSSQLDQLAAGGSTKTTLTRAPLAARNWLAAHLDWLLLGAGALALVWLLFLFGGPLLRRRHLLTPDNSTSSSAGAGKMSRKFRFERGAGGKQAGWRFQTSSSSRASSTNEFGLFASNKFGTAASATALQNCYAAYGVPLGLAQNTSDSNGGDSSEHTDMVQSCSQSSHYEDFLKHQVQQQQQPQHQRAIYLNQSQLGAFEASTLSHRPLVKSTTGSHYNEAPSTATFRQPIHAARIYAGQQQQAATSLRPSAHRNPQQQQQQQQQVPIIGMQSSSRIHFNELHGQQTFEGGTLGRPQARRLPPAASGQEHIYHDVIYNQMIL